MELQISSIPFVKRGNITYTVNLRGGVSLWFNDPVYVQGVEGQHYNFFFPVSDFIRVAQVGLPQLAAYISGPYL